MQREVQRMKKEQTNLLDVFGTIYKIGTASPDTNVKMKDAAGLCECYSKEIFIDTDEDNYKEPMAGFDAYCHKVLRHEAFHAIFHEAGIKRYEDDEDLVEMLAILYPKIRKIMDEADALDIAKI